MTPKDRNSQELPQDDVTRQPGVGKKGEVADAQLEQVSGGVLRRSGDDDLRDLEVER